jgi:hypothetical protein
MTELGNAGTSAEEGFSRTTPLRRNVATAPRIGHRYVDLLRIAGWALLVIVSVEVAYAYCIALLIGAPENAGTFGDMFGALNVVFAGLGFAGVIYTIRSQGNDAVETNKRHIESLALLETEVQILRESLKTQQERDRVETGPFLRLTEERFHGGLLHLVIENVGASVLCQHIESRRVEDEVRKWEPGAFVAGTTLHVQINLADPQAKRCELTMKFRDRFGRVRQFDIALERNQANREAARLDFWPLGDDEAVKCTAQRDLRDSATAHLA